MQEGLPRELRDARERLLKSLSRGVKDARVIEAMRQVPRERFVPMVSRHLAYEDIPLPIAEGQTISQPYIVAIMAEAMELQGRETVLEVGTGSGYQAAILSKLAARVLTVERFPSLAAAAEKLLSELGYRNVEVHVSGDTLGWRDEAPYEAIIVTAAAPSVPRDLLEQLATGGRLVIPVGFRHEQDLLKIRKLPDTLSIENLGPCRFVPLVGHDAWSESLEI